MANYYSNPYFFNNTYTDYNELPDKIKSVTKTRIMQGAKDLFSERVWGLGVLGNPATGEVERLTTQLNSLWD